MDELKNHFATVTLKLRKLIYILPLFLILAACDKNSVGYLEDYVPRQARSEAEFVDDPTLKVSPGCVVIGQLESKFRNKVDTGNTGKNKDTDYEGKKGFDIVPLNVPEAAEFKYRLDAGANIKVILKDAGGADLFTIDQTNKEASVFLNAGNYTFVLENLSIAVADSNKMVPYFFQPDRERLGLAPDDKPAQTEFYKVTDKATLISTTRCQYADLQNIQVGNMKLIRCDFRGSNFKKANFSGAFMDHVILSRANLSQTNFSFADLYGSTLDSLRDFSFADFSSANLSNATLSNSVSRNAIFFKSVLVGTNFNNTVMIRANFFAADLNVSSIQKADVSDSEMSYSILIRADAKGAIFCNTVRNNWKIDGLIVDSSTQCLTPTKTY